MNKEKNIIPLGDDKKFSQYLRDTTNTEKASNLIAFVTAVVSGGKSGAITSIGRIAQGLVKGKFIQILGEEIREKIKEGKIKEDFLEKMRNFHSFTELFAFIDGENPDEERFKAAKAMFFSLASVDRDEGQELLNYNLFKITLSLSATQILILKICYQKREDYIVNPTNSQTRKWRGYVAEKLGGIPVLLIINEEKQLVELNLLSGYKYGDQSAIDAKDVRLTELGIKFGDNLNKFK